MNSCRRSSVMLPVSVAVAISCRHSSSVEPDLDRERVQMADERLHQLPQAGIGAAVEAGPRARR